MRSLLFVPADSPSKLERGGECTADALILDLEDSVAPAAKSRAREAAAAYLSESAPKQDRPRLYVRINPLGGGLADDDLEAVVAARPDGIMLPKCESGADVGLLDARLAVLEAQAGIPEGTTRILPITTETPGSLFQLGSYAGASPRLDGLTWGAEDLSVELGAMANRDANGVFTDPYRLARALCLAGAASAKVPAIDTVYTDFRDLDGLRAECDAAARDGFCAKMAIHPAQLPVINEAFTPSEAMIAEAEAVLAAFGAAETTGVAGLNGQMLDRPHRLRAERLLARARAAGKR